MGKSKSSSGQMAYLNKTWPTSLNMTFLSIFSNSPTRYRHNGIPPNPLPL